MPSTEDAIKLQVQRVERAIETTFKEHLEPGLPANLLRTRGLAALAVHLLAAEDAGAAAESVIDGFGDFGLDAVYADEAAGRLLLVQSKWRENARRTIDVGETRTFTAGVHAVMNEQYERFRGKLDELAPRISSIISRHDAQIDLVVVTNSVNDLSADVYRVLREACEDYNTPPEQEPVRIRVLGLEDVHTHVLNMQAGSRIDLPVTLQGWGYLEGPYPSYYGCISVSQLADWYQACQDRLFERNIRRALGLTHVNQGLVETLCEEAEHFWYFNNGITVLCDRIARAPVGAVRHERAELTLFGVSVVNGAQTVASIAAAADRSLESLANAKVLAKIISLEDCPESFAANLTRANNTQNMVVDRDFVALDPRQLALKRDFAMTLGKTYAIKRGEPTPLPDEGCTVSETALALACAHPDARFAVYAHSTPGTLWSTESTRYRELFHDESVSPEHVWRLVRAARSVARAVAATAAATEGREHVVAKQCAELATHLVLRELGPATSEDLDRIGTLAPQVIGLIIEHVEREFEAEHVPTLFKNVGKCRELADLVAADVAQGRQPVAREPDGFPARAERLVFRLSRRGIEARGRLVGSAENNGFVVEAGSTAAREPLPSFERYPSAVLRRDWLVRQGVLRTMKDEPRLLVLMQDQYFDSPSQAAAVLLGAWSNARTDWRTADGRTLNRAQAELRDARVDDPQ